MPYNANDNELDVLKYWQEHGIFEKSVESRPENKPYVFFDGPPFATGLPHYGHILSSVIKDVVPRYWTMKGYRVRRRWGWDCHGLPIESLIEKELNISGKQDIERIGIDSFNETCKSKVLMYTREWKKMVDRIGRWIEFDDAYKTMDSTYMESVWWALKKIWNDGRIYEGRKVLMYCTRCETPVSKAEIAMDNSYKDLTEETVTAKFRIMNHESRIMGLKGDIFFLAWTTTPWTLPGNVALAVGKDIEYAVVARNQESGIKNQEFFVVAKDRVDHVFHGERYEIVKIVKGNELVGLEYEPLFDMPAMRESKKKAYYVAAGDFVTTLEGTGIVHTAVIYGEDDFNLGISLDLPMIPMLDGKGQFTDVAPEFIRGQYLKKAEKAIKQYLEEKNLLFSKEQHTHSYPHCWRCDTPLIYNAISAWFIDVQSIKPRLIELNKNIHWYPEHLKEGRFLNILETAPDWNISRNRYWATPLPFWKCQHGSQKSCDNIVCVGSVSELKELAVNFHEVYKTDKLEEMDLHKQYMDQIILKCDRCDGEMRRIPEVIDCWVEAASMPFAEFHYPFENEETFKKRFPGQFIAEYINQTRAWFYYMHVMGALLLDRNSFEHVVTTGVILNEKGEKMSKSKKNYPDPWLIIEQYGMDALRYYLMSSPVMQADNLFFSEREVRDVFNKVLNTLWNVVVFYSTYANQQTDSLETPFEDHVRIGSKNILDRWILAKLHMFLREVTARMDAYDVVGATRPIKDFIDDLSTWYLRRSRERLKGDDEKGKNAALTTLHDVLLTLSKIIAPFMPFIAEKIFLELKKGKNGRREESVHLAMWPEANKEWIDEQVLQSMDAARKAVELGLALRAEAGIKVRQPLSRLLVSGCEVGDELRTIIADELNVKEVIGDTREQDGWVFREDGHLRIGLDTNLTPELKKEGALREIIRAVNQLRKESGFTISDRITLTYETDDDTVVAIFEDYNEELKKSVLADRISVGAGEKEIEVNGKMLKISINK